MYPIVAPMKTIPSPVSLHGLQNPFRLSRLQAQLSAVRQVENLSRHDWQDNTREIAKHLGATPEKLRTPLMGLGYALGMELDAERAKTPCVRAFSQASNGTDDAWRLWVVLSRELSAQLLALSDECENGYESDFSKACGELWAQWGFDASESPQSDYSPTGRMFQRSLSARVSSGHIVLSQSGARDV